VLFRRRWEVEMQLQHAEDGFELTPQQTADEWADVLRLARDSNQSLEAIHVFVLAHVLRRPILVYSDAWVRDADGAATQPCRFGGVYLPLLFSSPTETARAPLALAYANSHFSALVAFEGALPDPPLLPVTHADGQYLPVHFATEGELRFGRSALVGLWLDVDAKTAGARLVTGPRKEFFNHLLRRYFSASRMRFQEAKSAAASPCLSPVSRSPLAASTALKFQPELLQSNQQHHLQPVPGVDDYVPDGPTVQSISSRQTTQWSGPSISAAPTRIWPGGGSQLERIPSEGADPADGGRVAAEQLVRLSLKQVEEQDVSVISGVNEPIETVLYITAVKARNLSRKVDAYCKVKYRSVKHKTKVVKNTDNPTWPTNTMQFVIKSGSDNASGQRGKLSGTTSPEPMSPVGGGHKTMADDVGNDDALDVSVWGRDRLARNFFLGGTLLQVRTLLGQGMEVGAGESWVPLHQLGVGDRRFKTKDASNTAPVAELFLQWHSFRKGTPQD